MLVLTRANNMSSLTQQMAASSHGWIKINVDEVTTKSLTVLAAVARDDNGIVIKVWSRTPSKLKLLPSYGLCYLHKLKFDRWSHIIVEGDAKSCFDSLASPVSAPNSSICNIISNILRF